MPEYKNEIVLKIGKDHYHIKNRLNEVLQKEYKVKDLDKDIIKKRKNGLPLRDSHIEVLKRYKINYIFNLNHIPYYLFFP